jgi:hypothetical protein
VSKDTGGLACTQEHGAGGDEPLPGGSHRDGWMGGQTLKPKPILSVELSPQTLCLGSSGVTL